MIKVLGFILTIISIVLKLSTAIPQPEPVIIRPTFCDPSQCPGCTFPVCDCAPLSPPIVDPVPVATTPIDTTQLPITPVSCICQLRECPAPPVCECF